MKCVVLFGGLGTRVRHLHNSNKAFILVNEKPVMYFVIKNLLRHFLKEDLIIITNPKDLLEMKQLFLNHFSFVPTILTQDKPSGIPDAIKLAESHIKEHFSVCLGDFYCDEIQLILEHFKKNKGNVITTNKVLNPEKYGVLYKNKVIEKPVEFLSNLAVRGFYIFSPEIFNLMSLLKPSKRQETEISDLLNQISFTPCEVTKVFDLGSEKGIQDFSAYSCLKN